MRWDCERGCPVGGAKVYPSAQDAHRYAHALETEPQRGRHTLLSTLPLLLVRWLRGRRAG